MAISTNHMTWHAAGAFAATFSGRRTLLMTENNGKKWRPQAQRNNPFTGRASACHPKQLFLLGQVTMEGFTQRIARQIRGERTASLRPQRSALVEEHARPIHSKHGEDSATTPSQGGQALIIPDRKHS
jgi:hypothetical protein